MKRSMRAFFGVICALSASGHSMMRSDQTLETPSENEPAARGGTLTTLPRVDEDPALPHIIAFPLVIPTTHDQERGRPSWTRRILSSRAARTAHSAEPVDVSQKYPLPTLTRSKQERRSASPSQSLKARIQRPSIILTDQASQRYLGVTTHPVATPTLSDSLQRKRRLSIALAVHTFDLKSVEKNLQAFSLEATAPLFLQQNFTFLVQTFKGIEVLAMQVAAFEEQAPSTSKSNSLLRKIQIHSHDAMNYTLEALNLLKAIAQNSPDSFAFLNTAKKESSNVGSSTDVLPSSTQSETPLSVPFLLPLNLIDLGLVINLTNAKRMLASSLLRIAEEIEHRNSNLISILQQQRHLAEIQCALFEGMRSASKTLQKISSI